MMKLKNLSYEELAENIKREQKKIIVYGAGMIGQIVVPDVIERFQLKESLCFFVDADTYKQGKHISVGNIDYEIKDIEALKAYGSREKNLMLLITNSHFEPVLKNLDGMEELDGAEACIVPVIQIGELKKGKKTAPVRLSEKPLIPKVIHYCWFSGKEMPDGFKRCIASWEKHCPDYEIKRWDESNYDVGKNSYMRDAYEQKKWGFVPDYARLDILFHHGGIYMDTDVELVNNLDELLYQEAFCGVEKWGNVNMGGCSGAMAGHPMIRKMLKAREGISFIREDGSLNLETCGIYETKPLIEEGMCVNNQVQTVGGMTVYSSDYFSPYDYMSGEITMTENTFSIHHFNGGWLDQRAKEQREKTQMQYRAVLQRMEREMQPLISVIIPIYNAEPYLQQCLESVINQTYRDLEIILVDDGSTDKSPGLCDAYAAADPRIKVIHKENEGLVRARKTGVSMAGGAYITYVDADDWIDPDTYETILWKMAGREADMILYGLVEEYEDRSVEKENLLAEGYYEGKKLRESVYPRMLCEGIFFRFGILPNLVCKLARRELLQKVQPMVSDEVEMGEDADCTFQMLLQAEGIQIIQYAPYHYRKRQNSMVWSRTSPAGSKSLYRDLKKAFEQSAQREALMSQLYRYMLFILLLKAAERFVEQKAFRGRFFQKRIVLYGAGGFGQEMYRLLTEKKPGEIVFWADQRYHTYRSQGLPVGSPEEIMEYAYDLVFIAVLDTQICRKIADSLMKLGVCEEKISYIEPDERYVEMVISILETGMTD